ncbi:unnamed protein product [Spirodela intermedia]|uniref:Tubby-like F-box protein n=1 Tax=Spirodela intermedia TaxID=51605 RepID=A0A7I8JMX1_SPIIN|nr:unnamed protein product [Spirodela intermedia]CAA6671479.1 unnamed protein product [Spirodela intermedia]
MPPDLLSDILGRVELSEDRWPVRKNVVACACVCKRWREITMGIVSSPPESGKITFPYSLKQRSPLQCFIKRNKKTSTFYLYLSLSPKFVDKGKFLLAARRFRRSACTEYIVSLDADDVSPGSRGYVGRLRSNFWGTKFRMYDSQPPFEGARPAVTRARRQFAGGKQVSPQEPAGSYEIGQVSFRFNLFRSKSPRRMSLHSPLWHEHLQCWCLNFHGRVTVASVKNFQLAAPPAPARQDASSRRVFAGDEETVLLQFGKVGDDLFTMDFRQPLSAFQAFAICLTSFGTKLACE